MTRFYKHVLPTAALATAIFGAASLTSTEATAQSVSDQYMQYHAAVTAVEECRGALSRQEHMQAAHAIAEKIGTTQVDNELSVLQRGKNMMRETVASRGCASPVAQEHLALFDRDIAPNMM